jgi:hypothetical protein
VPPVETPARKAEPVKAPEGELAKPKVPEPTETAKPKLEPETAKPKTEKPLAEGPAKAPYRPCFVAGTLIEGDGGAVGIERLGVGARVFARMDGTELAQTARVTAVHGGSTELLLHVYVEGARVTCTREHPFFVRGEGWVAAKRIAPGDFLEEIDGGTIRVAEVVAERVPEPVTTYNLSVENASTFFVRIGAHAVLVHNNGDLPDLDRVLYWFFGNKPRARPDVDLKGMSVWRTESRAEVNTLFDTRVNQSGRGVSDPHGFFTPEQLRKASLVAPETPGDPSNALTGKLAHHDVRPASNPDPAVKLTADEVKALDQAAKSAHSPANVMQPKILQGKC